MKEEKENKAVEEEKEFNLSDKDKKFLKRILNSDMKINDKLQTLQDKFDLSIEKIKEMIDFYGLILAESQFAMAKSHILSKKKRYIISSAQNASPVNKDFLANIEAYAKFINAEIGIIATRYRNPTSIYHEEGDIWEKELHKYLTATRQKLHKNLIMLGDLKIQATAPNPTNGIELMGKGASVIVGSPRIEMRVVPVLPEQEQIFLYSTGSVTYPNFTDTVAGGKSAEHHSYGFVVVEIESKDVVHIRSVSADDNGSFNDLIYRVEEGKVYTESVETLVWGDSHFAKKDENVTNAFRGLCNDLGITTSVLHDVWDSESINVHNQNNPVVQHKLFKEGKDSLKKEIKQMKQELNWFEENMEKTIVVASNHDDMLDRAMVQSDWRNNLKNAETFIKFLNLTLSGKASNGVIPYIINKNFRDIHALGLNDSFVKHGVELALHGHKGPNGSKGNINSFSKLAIKTIIGHDHSPAIRWGCYRVGISCKMDHDYNKGLSGWAYAGVTLNKHGKRQLIVFHRNTLTYTTLY